MSNKSISFVTKTQRKKNFEAARKLACQLEEGRMKRAQSVGTGIGHNTYTAMVDKDGKKYVIGDSLEDIPYPSTFIGGKPAMVILNYTTPLKLN